MTDAYICTKDAIASAINPCEYARIACEGKADHIDFINFYYCSLNENVPATIAISIIYVLFVFNLLSTTAGNYLAPALELMAKILKMSEAIAGVTLLALANAAMDVIAGVVAGGKGIEGIQIATGALFGGCIFTITCVVARCIYGAHGGEIKINSYTIKRDIAFLLGTILYFIFLAVLDTVTPPLAAGFFVIYLMYFAYVVFQERRIRKKNQAGLREDLLDSHDKASKNILRSLTMAAETDRMESLSSYSLKKIMHSMKRKGKSAPNYPNWSPSSDNNSDIIVLEKDSDNSRELSKAGSNAGEEEAEKSLFDRIVDIYSAPLYFIRDLTMPPIEEEKWNPYMAAATPVFGIAFVIWQVGFLDYFVQHLYLWVIYAVVVVPLSLWMLIQGRRINLVKYHAGKFATATFVVSALWLNFIATCFMDLLSLLTMISGLPLDYLSLTMIAWGNSLDDFFIDYEIARSGHGQMAISGAFAGQLFNLLIGFGGAILRETLTNKVQLEIFVFDSVHWLGNVLILMLLASLILCLLLTLLIAKLKNWVLGKRMMIFLWTFYFIFLVAASLIAVLYE